jgi:PhnB protein
MYLRMSRNPRRLRLHNKELLKEQDMPEANHVTRRHFANAAISTAALAAFPTRSIADVEAQKMTTLTPYLLFDGNCHQAMDFYKSCFGGELTVLKVKDSPAKEHLPASYLERTVNARLRSGNLEISASDWLRPDRKRIPGNTVCLYLSGGKPQELKVLFEGLSQGGDVTDPLMEQFFGIYGALNDKFSVRWMFQTAG